MAQQQKKEKTSWPELLGKTYEEAEAAIKKDNPSLSIFRVPENSAVTMDYRPDRVRVIVDEVGEVVQTPVTG